MARKRESPLDRQKLLEECEDEPSFAHRCLDVFVRDTQIDIAAIDAAIQTSDLHRAARLAHRIKGASASIRAGFLRQEAARLEALAGMDELKAARACFARLSTEFEHFKKFIAALPHP